MSEPEFRALVAAAAMRYRAAGRFAPHFARGKLAGDPVFRQLLARGLIGDGAQVLDLGSGPGLLAALLLEAAASSARGAWPAGWAPVPRRVRYRGVEQMARDVERARRAIPHGAEFEHGDIRTADFARADTVVILDVLHYLEPVAQQNVLARVRQALAPGGTLLVRVGDAAAGRRFRISAWVDRAVTFAREHRLARLHCRPLAEWQAMLESLGFTVQPLSMSAGTPFANVLLIARVDADSRPAAAC